jgi:diguanylate cyclase (GGDEF)-like protein
MCALATPERQIQTATANLATMATLAMAVLAATVAIAYFIIAIFVAPRIKMPSASARAVLIVRGAAIAFFIGCGATHIHIFVHTLGIGSLQRVEVHEFAFHAMQAVGAWLFIAGAILRLELHVVPSQTRTELEAAVQEQRRLADHATKLASQDELTGLVRRWRFEEELERQVADAARYDIRSALILIDVDGLKTLNDTHGHQAGDSVLAHVAECMRSQLRHSDVAARIGGDEFAIILPHAGIREAESIAQRIIATARRASSSGVPKTSVSAGLAAIGPVGISADIIKHADVALYQAKRAGGDRYEVSHPARPDAAVS